MQSCRQPKVQASDLLHRGPPHRELQEMKEMVDHLNGTHEDTQWQYNLRQSDKEKRPIYPKQESGANKSLLSTHVVHRLPTELEVIRPVSVALTGKKTHRSSVNKSLINNMAEYQNQTICVEPNKGNRDIKAQLLKKICKEGTKTAGMFARSVN
jgi:hypothetical protein